MAAVPVREQCAYQSCYCEENVYKLAEQLIAAGVPADILYSVFISNQAKQIPVWKQQKGEATMDGLVWWDYHVILIQLPSVAAHSPSESQGSHIATTQHNDMRSLASICSAAHAWVWDFDTQLPWPCDAQQYVQQALRTGLVLKVQQQQALFQEAYHDTSPTILRSYRVVPARLFLSHFASDRTHMLIRVQTNHSGHTSNDEDGDDGVHNGAVTASVTATVPVDSRWSAPPPPWPAIIAPATGHTNTLPQYCDMAPRDVAHAKQPGVTCEAGDGQDAAAVHMAESHEAWLGQVYNEQEFATLLLTSVDQPAAVAADQSFVLETVGTFS